MTSNIPEDIAEECKEWNVRLDAAVSQILTESPDPALLWRIAGNRHVDHFDRETAYVALESLGYSMPPSLPDVPNVPDAMVIETAADAAPSAGYGWSRGVLHGTDETRLPWVQVRVCSDREQLPQAAQLLRQIADELEQHFETFLIKRAEATALPPKRDLTATA